MHFTHRALRARIEIFSLCPTSTHRHGDHASAAEQGFPCNQSSSIELVFHLSRCVRRPLVCENLLTFCPWFDSDKADCISPQRRCITDHMPYFISYLSGFLNRSRFPTFDIDIASKCMAKRGFAPAVLPRPKGSPPPKKPEYAQWKRHSPEVHMFSLSLCTRHVCRDHLYVCPFS